MSTETLAKTNRIDMTGKKFGTWSVIRYEKTIKNAGAYWLCECSCGTIKSVKGSDLRRGISTKCKKCTIPVMRNRVENLVGRKFGEWSVIEMDRSGKRRGAYWLCECSCGNRHIVRAKDLRHGLSTRCKTCSRPKRQNAEGCLPNWVWNRLFHTAKKRNKELSVTKEQCYKKLVEQNFRCALSGMPLYVPKSGSEYKENGSTASLDRIDSSIGYTIDNIQWLHKDINYMKQQFSVDYFLELCKKVNDHGDRL